MTDPLTLHILAAAAFGYLCGSIPFGLLLVRAGGGGDIRRFGSGNIGTANVFRSGRKALGAATLVLDAAKAFLPMFILQRHGGDGAAAQLLPPIAGLGAVIGHIFPVWLRFRGGKGIACWAGALIAAPPLILPFALIWLTVFKFSRHPSLSSLAAALLTAPALPWALGFNPASWAMACLAPIAIVYAHRENLKRLREGQELTLLTS